MAKPCCKSMCEEPRRKHGSYCVDHTNEYQRNRPSYTRDRRQRAIAKLGGKCVTCGYDGVALHIDHIDYTKARVNGKREHDGVTVTKVLNGDTNLQLLCANCNWEKREELQEWGYQQTS